MSKVIVIGGGASGLMACYSALLNGNEVILLEKNEKLGKKIYITGKGRCNLTNDCSVDEFLDNVVNNSKFLIGAINNFSPEDTINFFQNNGLAIKTERGNRVFPLSDKASDVTSVIEKAIKLMGAKIHLNENAEDILIENNVVYGVKTNKFKYQCDYVICATGGLSYQTTGSTGDGYKFAKNLGHTIVPILPGLVGINIKEEFCKELQGLSLKNVQISAYLENKKVFEEFGEMLFTHFGISGPIVLTCSSKINRYNLKQIKILLDLKPAISDETLDNRLLRDFKELKGKQIKNSLDLLLPKMIIPIILKLSNIDIYKKNTELTTEERIKLIKSIKYMQLNPASLRPLSEAIITSGGISTKEINPKTMESKIIKNLHFCGEVIDVDALTGGFNLQIAFCTGYLAGNSIY